MSESPRGGHSNRSPIDARRVWLGVAALVVIAAISRLPQVLSPNLLVDGDEAILGLMAKHLAEGRELPVFFYGQHYGFSTIEAAAGAAGFLLFGGGPIPLKLAMLALWTTGVVFLFLALARIVGANRGFWIAAVFLLMPAWAVWSMKARGGYLTAFTASAVLLWLLARDGDRQPIARWLAAGALTGIVYMAQPLWLPGLLTILLVELVRVRRAGPLAAFLAVAAATVVLGRTSGGPALGNPNLLGSLPDVGRQIYLNMTGAYYLWWAVDPPGRVTPVVAWIWCTALPIAGLLQIYRLASRRPCRWSHVFFVALCATLAAEWLMLRVRDARYLLPVSGLLVMLAGVEVSDLIDRGIVPKRAAAGLTAAMLALGAFSLREFSAFTYLWTNPPHSRSEAWRLQQVVNYLRSENISHVFSMNGLLEPQLIFYSGERILARGAAPGDRYPVYVHAVDEALARGERVGIVGYTDDSGAPGCWDVPICSGDLARLVRNPEAIYTVDGKYFVYAGADRALLERLKFRFWE